MADYGKFKVGNVIYPLTADTTNSLLQDSDPALFYIIDFIRTVLQTYVGERWKSEIDKINSEKGGIPINDGYVVATTYPYDPKRFYLQNKPVFPILAIYEIDSETELKTLCWYHTTRTLQLVYSLPPLTAGQVEMFMPMLKNIENIIVDRVNQGYDPSYYNSREVWSDGYAGIESIWVQKGKKGNKGALNFPEKAESYFPTLTMPITVTTRQMFDDSFLEDLNGIDVEVPTEGTPFEVDFKVDLPV